MKKWNRTRYLASCILVTLLLSTGTWAADSNGWTLADAAHLLRRAGFGGTPAQIDRLYQLGREGAVDYLITGKLADGKTAPFDHVDLPAFQADSGLDQKQGPERQFEMLKLRSWWIDRMVRTDRPLEEKMSLFWHGLFTSGIRECKVPRWMVEQNELFHKEALGNYERLTDEIIHDSAMLKYLNNDENIKGHPNENLAREMMELFTMGEGNGYSEKDIPQVARALTGLTPRRPMFNGRAVMIPQRHDAGLKTIFGRAGNYGPDDVVKLIFSREYPANYLSMRLWTFFGTADPSSQSVSMVAHVLRSNHWDLAPALRAMFLSPEFRGDSCRLTMIKSPIDLEVGTLRLLEEPSQPRIDFAASLSARQLGQDLFQPPNVKGWPGGEHWITSAGIYTRYNIASAMANGTFGSLGDRPRDLMAKPGKTVKATGIPIDGQASVTPPATAITASAAVAPDHDNNPKKAQKKEAKKQAVQAARQQIIAQLRQLPEMPPADELVQPAKLFSSLPRDSSAKQIVDAAIARFLQQPLPDEKRSVLVDALGDAPITLGQPQSDRRVRQMLALLMSTPEYQME